MRYFKVGALVVAVGASLFLDGVTRALGAPPSFSIVGTWHCTVNDPEHDVFAQTFHADGFVYETSSEFGPAGKTRYPYSYKDGILRTRVSSKVAPNVVANDEQKIVWNGPNKMAEVGLGKDTYTEQCHR